MSDILSPLKRYESLQTNKSTNKRKKRKSYIERNSSNGNNSYLSMNSYIMNKKYNFINSFILVGCWNHIDCDKSALNTPIFRDIVINQIIIDRNSLELIKGSTLDYKKELIGDSFVIKNPKAKSSCGCGLSFSV